MNVRVLMLPLAVAAAPLHAALAAPLAAQAAPRVATALEGAELVALDAIRKDVWVHWFSGDTAALRRVLGPELVAISPDAPHWQSLRQTLDGSTQFTSSGARFISVDFDSTLTLRFGDVVVMFSHYRVVTESDGKRAAQAGRATEVFVRANGRWVHTSWHLDVLP
jgi:ketosteroid isomerase-like protein